MKKAIVVFEVSTLEFIGKFFLIIIVNFGVWYAFSNCSGFAFPGQGTRPLYKVCLQSYAFLQTYIWEGFIQTQKIRDKEFS